MKQENINIFDDDIIIIPIPENLHDCIKLAQSDFYRYTGKENASLFKMLLSSFWNYNFSFCLWFRLAKIKSFLFPFFRWKLERTSRKHCLSFSRNVKCGYGLHIVHAIGIIVNHTAIIGNNVTIHQHTNIGSDKNKSAVIGDNVYIGPQVCLVENVHIGSNVVIGAGTIVVKNLIKGIFAGNPAHIIKDSSTTFMGHHPYPIN